MRPFLIALILMCAGLFGCGGVPLPVARAYHGAVSPRYLRSVDADAGLNDAQKRQLRRVIASFERALNKAEGK